MGGTCITYENYKMPIKLLWETSEHVKLDGSRSTKSDNKVRELATVFAMAAVARNVSMI
jgi:hypothetical protein